MDEVIFSHNETRCHAKIVCEISGDEKLIGELNGYYIYQLPGIVFDQFGFLAVKKEA